METTEIKWLLNNFSSSLRSGTVHWKQQPMGKKKASCRVWSDIWILWLPLPASMDNSWATAKLWKGISIILCQYKLHITFTRSFISSLRFEERWNDTASSGFKTFQYWQRCLKDSKCGHEDTTRKRPIFRIFSLLVLRKVKCLSYFYPFDCFYTLYLTLESHSFAV